MTIKTKLKISATFESLIDIHIAGIPAPQLLYRTRLKRSPLNKEGLQ